ncbi:MAG: cell surface protein SprA [Prevotella sp.]|nr:cell surface protein SprA [Prevotella sp.]
MQRNRHILLLALLAAVVVSYAASVSYQSVFNPASTTPAAESSKGIETLPPDSTVKPKAQPIFAEEEDIPDSMLNTRWKVQRTVPITDDDLRKNAMDLERPENLKQQVVYNDTLDTYVIGSRMGNTYVSTPIMMSMQEYLKWSERQLFTDFFRQKNTESYETQGKEKFDFTDMHFDLGPAEKIFGPGGVRIKTQGTAELKFGLTLKNIDNPSLPIRNRKTTTMDFDEKINMNMNGKVGDKVNMNLNYNTDATFDADAQNMKLKYDGKEDEIVKLVEAGNVSFPANSSLIRGASSLFGLRTDLQFGKLKLQTVVSQKKSSNTSVSSKGGAQTTTKELNVANYEENRHFFLSQYFRDRYNDGMKTLPNLMTGIKINRVEVWVTNKSGSANNTRDIIAFTDLGENDRISNTLFTSTGQQVPSNAANTEYSQLVGSWASARDVDQTSSTLDGAGLVGGTDYEKLESARLLNSSEYTINDALGYITMSQKLQPDQVLAVAFEYTYGGQTYQVGEFASDITDVNQALFVKALKNTSNNPTQGNWDLMMKNAYNLGTSSIQKEKFRLDIKFQSDTSGVYLSYIPEQQVKEQPLIRLMGADRLDNNNKPHSNGYFDFIEGYTVANGSVFLPTVEPFGENMYQTLVSSGVAADVAAKYAFTELYDSTQTVAKQIAEKNKYQIIAQYRGRNANVISLGATQVPQGSVVVTAGGVTLTEGTDYTVDYAAGEVRILNQSIIDAQTPINVSSESNSDYGQARKTMVGINWEYDFSKNFQMSGTLQHLSEQALTTKVSMGSEPLNNTLWGVNINWKKESQWLTNMLDKIPLLHLTQPSNISFTGEFAHLIAGKSHGTQDNASYLDDFENTTTKSDMSTPSSWTLSSVPTMFPDYNDKTSLKSGFNRAQMAWYTIDPLFTRRSSSLTPGHIKSDLNQLSNHYVREVAVRELYPNRDQSTYNGATSMLPILNVAYYPDERGPYNFNPDLQADGKLNNPKSRWGGMMRRLNTTDFEDANIEYIEFWLMDPFIYTRRNGTQGQYGGDLYFNLGEVSEDILCDGKKFYESGMPVDGSGAFTTTQWGKIPTQTTVNYAFATSSGSRALQDVGFNGLTDDEERTFQPYQDFLSQIQGKVPTAVYDSIYADPANDNYHYFRGSDFDQMQADILRRYKYINNPQGNSPDSDSRNESYDTSYKTTPDVEDINQDYTLNEYEKYYQYHVSLRDEDLVVGQNYIVDKREGSPTLRNGEKELVTWYQFRIPVDDFEKRVGSISDFSSIRFIRMFLTNFEHPVVLRFGSLDLVRGEWRVYEQNLDNVSGSGRLNVSEVNIEENNDKTPVNYVLPPGIRRVQDPSQPQLVEANEQALNMVVNNLSSGESKAVYKNTAVDLRQYKRLQLFIHANAFEQNTTNLQDNQLAVFIRLGSDYKSNYYEYEIPLKLTPPGNYDRYSPTDVRLVWPQENLLDVPLTVFTSLKRDRNIAKGEGRASYSQPFTAYDAENPNNKLTILGNPSLGEVKTMIIGVRNNSNDIKSGEVWVNELRLKEYNNEGGWAAQGNLNMQLSDLGTLNMQGRYITDGFGGIEEGVMQRSTENQRNYTITTSLELGKFFPEKVKVSAPLYYSVTKEESSPKYNPLDTDLELREALDATVDRHERDSIESITVTKTTNTNFSLSNVRIDLKMDKKHPMPFDPANFSFSYSHSHRNTSGETTVYEREDTWLGRMSYQWVPVYKSFEPFKKKIKSKSKWYDLPKQFTFNWLPQNISFNTDVNRSYHELQERDMEDLGGSSLPLTFNQIYHWNRDFSLKWDFTKNLHMSFQSATRAEVEEPYTPVNKDLYPDRYEAWKDSVRTSLRNFGTPLDYNQSFSLSYKAPFNLIPIFNWITADAKYDAKYTWVRGSDLEDGTSLGNTITNNRTASLNSTLNLEKLYALVPFLKATNDRFNKDSRRSANQSKAAAANKKSGSKEDEKMKGVNASALNKELPKNKKGFESEVTLMPDTVISVKHGKKSKRLIVTAKTEEGKLFPIKYKVEDDNTIRILTKVDSATKVKVTVTPKQPLDELKWYRYAQSAARFAMMVRNVSLTYRNTTSLGLPGFMPSIGDAFGQKHTGDILSPGLDFAFGLTDDNYIERARENGWLLLSDAVATPATTSHNEDLQLRMTVEPFRNFKIDVNASRAQTTGKSIQYMYAGNPTTQTGTFNMTTISIGSAFEGIGNANNGYPSKSFEKFCNSIDDYRNRVEKRYENAIYPALSPLGGKKFNAENGGVNRYSADVLVPAFLASYTSMGGKSLDIFPSLSRLLPNWSVTYSGLSKLTWFKKTFKSVNIKHSYKSVFAIGSYSTYSTYMEFMEGLGFITDATTGNPVPNSMYNVSTASINEQLQPIAIDVTFPSGMTAGIDYKQNRVLTLSMTSMQINETRSNDWSAKWGYKINDFSFKFGGNSHRKVKSKNKGNEEDENNQSQSSQKSSQKKNGVNHDLNLNFTLTYRQQAAIIRDIASMTSTASSGNKNLKFSFMADYTLSKLLTMTFYYEHQGNTPLLSSSSYPTTTRDFGFSMKFSLTR